MSEREIDEILAASFPASDPPPWTLGLDEERLNHWRRSRNKPRQPAEPENKSRK